MRRAILVAVAILCAACHHDTTAPQIAEVQFRVDGLTCTGSATILFFIDGAQIGSEALNAGQTSQAYLTTPGTHLAGARTATSSYTWPTGSFTFTANETFTVLLTC